MRRLLLLCLFAGCAGDPTSVEDTIEIDQGLYGRLTIASDTSPGEPGIDKSAPVSVFEITAHGPELLAIATSDLDGIYEFGVEPGSYELCVNNAKPEKVFDQWQMNCAGPCTLVDVGVGLVRADWELNLSGGWWSAGDHCPR